MVEHDPVGIVDVMGLVAELDRPAQPALADRPALDDTGLRRGAEVSLRWIYVHMSEEYARHNGHADLIRELVDGAVGW